MLNSFEWSSSYIHTSHSIQHAATRMVQYVINSCCSEWYHFRLHLSGLKSLLAIENSWSVVAYNFSYCSKDLNYSLLIPYLAKEGYSGISGIFQILTWIINLIYEVLFPCEIANFPQQSLLLCWFQFEASSGNFSIVTELLLYLPY